MPPFGKDKINRLYAILGTLLFQINFRIIVSYFLKKSQSGEGRDWSLRTKLHNMFTIWILPNGVRFLLDYKLQVLSTLVKSEL